MDRHEKLSQFCFLCGLLGHNDSACYNVTKPVPKFDDYHNKLRVWLRSIRYDRRIK